MAPTPMHDVSGAAWVHERLWDWPSPSGGIHVGSILPAGYEGYARVFHPLHEDGEPVRWATVARRNGRVVHDQMQYHRIAVRSGYARELHSPAHGSLDRASCEALVRVLRPYTDTPDRCRFGLWTGYGGLPGDLRAAPTFGDARARSSGRQYILFAGPIEDAADLLGERDQSPNLWWPDDRAWFVATEIDYAWTYVGGSRACIDAVLAAPELEALETTAAARGDSEGDLMNR